MNKEWGTILTVVVVLIISVVATADRLPNQTPENQIFTIDTVIDSTGSVDAGTDMKWLITSPGAIETGIIANHGRDSGSFSQGMQMDSYFYPAGKVIADVAYTDDILTNGGIIILNRNFIFDSKETSSGLYNIESEKVLTYNSRQGSHLTGEEKYTIDGAGEAKKRDNTIRCVFSSSEPRWIPPFCNIVTATSNLINMNTAQVTTKGQIRAVSKNENVPTEMNYRIAITPDSQSGSGFAEGTVQTTYAGSIMEGRDSGMYLTAQGAHELNNWYHTDIYHAGDPVDWDALQTGTNPYSYFWVNETAFETSAENSWKDITTVSGGIKNFQKSFGYKSGVSI